MKNFLFLIAFLFTTALSFAQVSVSGYYRSNGTYVKPHQRTAPNYTRNDNYSTVGNVNPYTGTYGTKPRDTYYTTPSYSAPSYNSTINYSNTSYSSPSPVDFSTSSYSNTTYAAPSSTIIIDYSNTSYSSPSPVDFSTSSYYNTGY